MKTKIFAMAIAALALAACDKNNDDFTVDNLKDTPITIASTNVADLTTRAINNGLLEGTSDAEATMSVWITGSDDKYSADNMKWSHNGASWSSNTTVLYEGAEKQTIYALSPYVTTASYGMTVEADGVSMIIDGKVDYLVATETCITGNPVRLNMSHALTKLVLNPTYGSEVAEADRKIKEVSVLDMCNEGKLNIVDNTWSEQGNRYYQFEMINNEVLVMPIDNCTSFRIKIYMEDAREFVANISLADVGNKLEGGTRYTINLQIGRDVVAVDDVAAASWGVPVNGGEVVTK